MNPVVGFHGVGSAEGGEQICLVEWGRREREGGGKEGESGTGGEREERGLVLVGGTDGLGEKE